MSKIALEKRTVLGVALGTALLSATPVSLHWSPAQVPSLSFDRADAQVGQPASPGSVAGVHRRTTRRAAAAGAAGAAANNGSGSGVYNYSAPATAAPATAAPAADTANSTLLTESPELYAACLNRTYGACPNQ